MTHSHRMPWKNFLRKLGHATKSTLEIERPPSWSPAHSEAGRTPPLAVRTSGASAVHSAAQSAAGRRKMLRHLWLSHRANPAAKQPCASSSAPPSNGARLPKAWPKKSPSITSAAAASSRETMLENCGLYQPGPLVQCRARDTTNPRRGTRPHRKNERQVASPDLKATEVPLGIVRPSSWTIMCSTQKSSYFDSAPATVRASSSEMPRLL
mmetsp:Transcript_9149/g.24303  ORF Transcript_9149/g.24303 Transcript_9149/m.24303 type:complete len:210 (+) Transcript_9149:923-1552(+)